MTGDQARVRARALDARAEAMGKQTLLFSASMPPAVERFAKRVLRQDESSNMEAPFEAPLEQPFVPKALSWVLGTWLGRDGADGTFAWPDPNLCTV